jgi:hypothetical protein
MRGGIFGSKERSLAGVVRYDEAGIPADYWGLLSIWAP